MQNILNKKNNESPVKTGQKKELGDKDNDQQDIPLTITWQAQEYEYIRKSSDWYWAVGILTLGLFTVALIFQNVLFAVFMLIAGFTTALYGARPPRTVNFELSSEGIHIHNRMYTYEMLQSFWIFYHPPDIKEISIESQKFIMPHIKIPLGDTNPVAVRAYLQQFLPERQQEESLIETGTRFLGF
jgi:hypothetical protein